MNIRYQFRNIETKKVWEEILTLKQIECLNWMTYPWYNRNEILSRDIGTGMMDKTGKEIFERDKLDYWWDYSHNTIIVSIPEFYKLNIEWQSAEIIGREEAYK